MLICWSVSEEVAEIVVEVAIMISQVAIIKAEVARKNSSCNKKWKSYYKKCKSNDKKSESYNKKSHSYNKNRKSCNNPFTKPIILKETLQYFKKIYVPTYPHYYFFLNSRITATANSLTCITVVEMSIIYFVFFYRLLAFFFWSLFFSDTA